MLRTQISLTPAEHQTLTIASKQTGRSMSALIREAIDTVYGQPQTIERDIAAIQTAFGAWDSSDGRADGAEFVEQIRSGGRLAAATTR